MFKANFWVALIAILFTTKSVNAQTGTIGLTAYMHTTLENGKWLPWSNNWINYLEEGTQHNPTIQITRMGQDPYVYNMRYFTDEGMVANFDVVYDGEKSSQMRKQWNDNVTNCYKDDAGDYIYVRKTSLDELCQKPDKWKDYENSEIYMYIQSEKFAVVVK